METMELYWTVVMYAGSIADIIIAGCLLHRFVKPFLSEDKKTYMVGVT